MSWTIHIGKFGPALRRSVICASCGDAFDCEVSLGGCWCGEITLTDETRAQVKATFSDCLCRACLTKFQAGGTVETRHSEPGP